MYLYMTIMVINNGYIHSVYRAVISEDVLLTRGSVLFEITAVKKTERLLLCVSLKIIRNRMDLQDYCSVQYVHAIHHTHETTHTESTRQPPQSVSWVRASLQTTFTTQTAAFSRWGNEEGGWGGDEEGNAFIFSSNGDVITKRAAHSPQGF